MLLAKQIERELFEVLPVDGRRNIYTCYVNHSIFPYFLLRKVGSLSVFRKANLPMRCNIIHLYKRQDIADIYQSLGYPYFHSRRLTLGLGLPALRRLREHIVVVKSKNCGDFFNHSRIIEGVNIPSCFARSWPRASIKRFNTPAHQSKILVNWCHG